MQKLRKLFPLVGAILALAFVSCGSDSDDGSETVTQQKSAGSISYATTSVEKTTDDEAFTNALTKTGDGTVTYASSKTDVATVNATTGEVTIVGAGETTITATVADSDSYTYATKTASYALTVTAADTAQQKTAGSISYATTTVSKTTDDEPFTNSLTKTGDGTVSYASSKTDVAEVNATTGEVTIKVAGEATITATVTDSDTYTYATKTASYTLTVTATYTVTLTGGANATISGGNTTQEGLSDAMETVTFTANDGYYFEDFTDITSNGITATRTSDSVVTVSGTPTGNASITIPDATEQQATTYSITLTGPYSNFTLVMEYQEGDTWNDMATKYPDYIKIYNNWPGFHTDGLIYEATGNKVLATDVIDSNKTYEIQ